MSETSTLTAAHVPTVYFIDDSATMREVIKIAFRKENIHVITCADAASALAQFGETAPDAVITDVIMPDKDGYEVCRFIKQHEQLGKIPVILMSGIVNQSVAEKATTVKADELIRKPFQPQDLVARVRSLIGAKAPVSVVNADPALPLPFSPSRGNSDVLGSFFAPPAPATPSFAPTLVPAPVPSPVQPVARTAIREETAPAASPAIPVTARPSVAAAPVQTASAAAPPVVRAAAPAPSAPSIENQKLRNEVRRLELLVKRLQAELAAGREYCAALEAHFKNLQEAE